MTNGGAHDGEAGSDVSGKIEAQYLGGDRPLVVVRGHYNARFSFPGARKDGLRGQRAPGQQSLMFGVADGRGTFWRFLFFEQALLTGMRVQPGGVTQGNGNCRGRPRGLLPVRTTAAQEPAVSRLAAGVQDLISASTVALRNCSAATSGGKEL